MGKGCIIELGPEKYPFDLERWFPADLNTVGISFTGGIESTAILCACIAQYKKEQIRLFHIPHRQTEHSYNVARTLGFETMQKMMPLNDIDNDFGKQLWLRANAISDIDVFYVGLNYKQNTSEYHIDGAWDWGFAAPLLGLHKYHAIDLIYKLGFGDVLKLCFSCCRSSTTHCGACENCIERRDDGFGVLGIEDPTIYGMEEQIHDK